MIARYASALSAGTFMTVALLFVMQILINMQSGEISEHPTSNPVLWQPYDELPPPPTPEPRKIDREKLTKTVLPPAPVIHTGGDTTITAPPPARPTAAGNGFGHLSEQLRLPKYVDGSLVALIRVAPTYPIRARIMGLEGHVLVQFDVLPDGHVANVLVVESSDQRFEKESIKAALRFKFRPRVVDGVPLLSTGVQNLFTFEMENK